MIPRLPPASDPIDVTITINKKLRPYFEIWFQRKKLDGETIKQFGLRKWKESALNDYLSDTGQSELNNIEQQKADSIEALKTDVELLRTEVD